ncbi:hypothetical protein [Cyanobium sp. ATX 6F1]|uniref:hypothetical protein n=1 Tax=unclassified Cyanobium TaxID=2627006 RepID=UPI0020CBD5A3|nr:hypothetical protein [Cyanobium sp. ATX 6F1]MCP9915321.1 hypothetical protein [Cyanobium sp. ATX 6F1]
MAISKGPPLSPKEGWLSDGRQVLRFRPTRWERNRFRIVGVLPGPFASNNWAT